LRSPCKVCGEHPTTLKGQVQHAFAHYDEGDYFLFATLLMDVADVRWDWHRKLVDDEFKAQAKKRHYGWSKMIQ
jgi:hypothetical protein